MRIYIKLMVLYDYWGYVQMLIRTFVRLFSIQDYKAYEIKYFVQKSITFILSWYKQSHV
jgi:hypothetical protein